MYLITFDFLQMDFHERGKIIRTDNVPRDTHVNRNPIQGRGSTEDQKIPNDMMGQSQCLVCTHAS